MSVGHPEKPGAPPANDGAVRPKADSAEPSGQSLNGDQDLSLIISTIPGMLWSAIPDGAVDYCNRPWLEFASMTAEQAKGWGWTAAIHQDDRKSVIESWRASLGSGGLGSPCYATLEVSGRSHLGKSQLPFRARNDCQLAFSKLVESRVLKPPGQQVFR